MVSLLCSLHVSFFFLVQASTFDDISPFFYDDLFCPLNPSFRVSSDFAVATSPSPQCLSKTYLLFIWCPYYPLISPFLLLLDLVILFFLMNKVVLPGLDLSLYSEPLCPFPSFLTCYFFPFSSFRKNIVSSCLVYH